MKDVLLGIGLMAALFALSGVFRQRGCTGHCPGCSSDCGRFQEGGQRGP